MRRISVVDEDVLLVRIKSASGEYRLFQCIFVNEEIVSLTSGHMSLKLAFEDPLSISFNVSKHLCFNLNL